MIRVDIDLPNMDSRIPTPAWLVIGREKRVPSGSLVKSVRRTALGFIAGRIKKARKTRSEPDLFQLNELGRTRLNFEIEENVVELGRMRLRTREQELRERVVNEWILSLTRCEGSTVINSNAIQALPKFAK